MSEVKEEGAARSLREIQSQVATLIRCPLTGVRMQRSVLPDDPCARERAREIISSRGALSGAERLAIYNRQYWYRLLDVLYDDLPGLGALLGAERFLEFRIAYLTRFPSQSFSLHELPSRVVEFLEESDDARGPAPRRLLVDMARLEWAHLVAYDAPEWPRATLEDVGATSPEDLHLTLQPYVTLLDLAYPVDEVLISLKREARERSEAGSEEPRREVSSAPLAPIESAPVQLAVHRVGGDVFYKRMEPPAFMLLRELANGATLTEACAHLHEGWAERGNPRAMTEEIRRWFVEWGELGWFSHLTGYSNPQK